MHAEYTNGKEPALIIYTDGTYERMAPMTGLQQMQIGQGLINEVHGAVLPPSQPQPVKERIEQADD